MSTETTVDHSHGDHDSHDTPASDTASKHGHGLTDLGYVKVAIVLAVMTGAEVTLTYLHLPGGVFMAFLLTLMVLKFWTVVSFFMHLRFDNRIFTWLFYTGLILAVCVYVIALSTFQFFATS